MERYLKLSYDYEILLKVLNGKVFFVIPDYDILDKPCYTSEVRKYSIKFKFDSCVYIINLKNLDKSEVIIDDRHLDLDIEEISSDLYANKISNFKNRLELLQIPYKKSCCKINFRYKLGTKQLMELNKFTRMSQWLVTTDTMSKIKSVLDWMDLNFQHLSHQELPSNLNSIELVKFAKSSGGKLNCRGIAVVANELLLAANLFSRMILCFPKSKKIINCHFINEVYVPELKKWIFVDPTYHLYLYHDGDLLSLQEVRECISKKLFLQFNSQANYHKKKLAKELYIKAQTRNFYGFATPRISQYGSYINNDWVTLTPQKMKLDFIKGISIDNPDVFFMEPNLSK